VSVTPRALVSATTSVTVLSSLPGRQLSTTKAWVAQWAPRRKTWPDGRATRSCGITRWPLAQRPEVFGAGARRGAFASPTTTRSSSPTKPRKTPGVHGRTFTGRDFSVVHFPAVRR
jgi:hypothetical protein